MERRREKGTKKKREKRERKVRMGQSGTFDWEEVILDTDGMRAATRQALYRQALYRQASSTNNKAEKKKKNPHPTTSKNPQEKESS